MGVTDLSPAQEVGQVDSDPALEGTACSLNKITSQRIGKGRKVIRDNVSLLMLTCI